MLHLTVTQVIRAVIDAQGIVESLVEAKVYSRHGMDADRKAEADDAVVRKVRSLVAELGYRIEPVHIEDGAML